MKIIEMERRTMDGKPVEYGIDENGEDYRDWFCVIETKEEELVYDIFVKNISSNIQDEALTKLWNKLVIHAGQGMGVSWGDDDMYGYIRPDEVAPEIGEEYIDGDSDKWIRVS